MAGCRSGGQTRQRCGTYRKPAVKGKYKMNYPHHSDSFDKPELAPIWEFNYVPYKEKWSLTDRPGYFRIYAQYAKGFIGQGTH